MRTIWLWMTLALLLAGCGRPVPVVDPEGRDREQAWSGAVLDAARAIPVQHEGRVKPLDTLASFALYSIHGRRDMKFCWGEQQNKVVLTPTEWLLDVLFYPHQAGHYPLFRVENASVFRALWPKQAHAQKMDFEYLSYEELAPQGNRLLQLVREIEMQKSQNQFTPDERALQLLRDQLWSYHTLHQELVVLQHPYAVQDDQLKALFGNRERVGFGEILGRASQIAALADQAPDPSAPEPGSPLAIGRELAHVAADKMSTVKLFPPSAGAAQAELWHSIPDIARLALQGQLPEPEAKMVSTLNAVALSGNHATREEALLRYQRQVVAAAEARGDYDTVALEAKYYDWTLSYKALHWFLSGFFCVALGWLFVRSRWITWLAAGFTAVGLGFLIGDVTMRILIRGYAPITNLFDTFLFIAMMGVSAALVTELFTKRRIALSVAPIMGAVLIMLARAFEASDGVDTMKELPAVLRSNYWLATHVTAINTGYAAGMLGMLLANVWLLMRAFGLYKNNPALHKSVVRMVYGVTCFGLLFTVFGTIYGGVWANDSWGRFWGWDPKENGALLICLSQIALLHARMSGMVRDFGFCLWAGITGLWVAFSWFGVNVMGVGLHSYGFNSGIKQSLLLFYLVEGGILLVGIVGHLLASRAPAVERAAAEAH